VPSLTLSAPTAQDWGRVRPSRRASVVRQPPWDPTEKGLYVDYPLRQQFAAQGIETIGGTPQQFASYIRSEIDKWATVIKVSGAKAE
jgi:hypothetical protein